jgi:dTDP-4-amino-4,6-dideoxygalactose transaminase
MSEKALYVYCGTVGLRLRNIIGSKVSGGISSYFNKHDFLYVHKGRTAINLACQILGLRRGDEILAPSYNCGSEIDALIGSGLSVSLYRVDRSALIDVQDIERKITKQTKVIYITHYFGFPQAVEDIKTICKKNKLYLIEDCALALFSGHRNNMIGTTGDVSIYSLPKTLPVPDGGVLLINNTLFKSNQFSLAKPECKDILIGTLPLLKVALLRWCFQKTLLCKLQTSSHQERYTFKEPNRDIRNTRPDMPQSYYYNDRLNDKDISYMTRKLMETFDPGEIKKIRRRNFIMLGEMFDRSLRAEPLYKELPNNVCPLNFPLIVEKRDEIVERLNSMFIDARPWWRGFHKTLPWSEFPEACFLKDHLITLPVHQDISESALRHIAKCVRELTNTQQQTINNQVLSSRPIAFKRWQ